MSKGSERRPERLPGSFGRGWERIQWSEGRKPLRYKLVGEEEWKRAERVADVTTAPGNGDHG